MAKRRMTVWVGATVLGTLVGGAMGCSGADVSDGAVTAPSSTRGLAVAAGGLSAADASFESAPVTLDGEIDTTTSYVEYYGPAGDCGAAQTDTQVLYEYPTTCLSCPTSGPIAVDAGAVAPALPDDRVSKARPGFAEMTAGTTQTIFVQTVMADTVTGWTCSCVNPADNGWRLARSLTDDSFVATTPSCANPSYTTTTKESDVVQGCSCQTR